MAGWKRKSPDSDSRLETLLDQLKATKSSEDLPNLNKVLSCNEDLLPGLEPANRQCGWQQYSDEFRRIKSVIECDSRGYVSDVKNNINKKLTGFTGYNEIEDHKVDQMITEGMAACRSFAVAGHYTRCSVRELHKCALSLKHYRLFNEAFQEYKSKEGDIVAALSLLVTPVTTVFLSTETSKGGDQIFHSGKYPKWMIASFMSKGDVFERMKSDPLTSDALKQKPHFVSDFGNYTESNDESPLTANGPLKILWERAGGTTSIKSEIRLFLDRFKRDFQLIWSESKTEIVYTRLIASLYKYLLNILNCILPPSAQLIWEGNGEIRSDVLVSMLYKVQVNGETKTLKLPIYCAEYNHAESLISLGMKAVDGTFDRAFHDAGETFMDEYKEHSGRYNYNFSSIRWEDTKSRASKRGNGLQNANLAMRQAALSKPLEDYLDTLRDDCSSDKFSKLACVSAVGIGDGCSHSMALISRRKEDFDSNWCNLKYLSDDEQAYEVPPDRWDEDEQEPEYEAPPALCEAEGMTGNISKFYECFQRLEQENKDGTMRPRLVFSDYLHMDDDERFVFRVARGLMSLVSMNIVVMFYLKGYYPDDGKVENDKDVHEYIKHLTNALGSKFKEDYSDIFSSDKTENETCSNHSQDKISRNSFDRDNGLVYRYILQSKGKFQSEFIEWVRRQNKIKWKLAETPLAPLSAEYRDIKPDSSGRRTIRDDDRSFRYLIDISPESILVIRKELEAHYRITSNYDKDTVAPRFIDFGFYSYKCIGVSLYKMYIHVEGIDGANDSVWEEDQDINSRSVIELAHHLLRYDISFWDMLPTDLIMRDNNAYAINFSRAKFTEERKFTDDSIEYESYEVQTVKLIKALRESDDSVTVDSIFRS